MYLTVSVRRHCIILGAEADGGVGGAGNMRKRFFCSCVHLSGLLKRKTTALHIPQRSRNH